MSRVLHLRDERSDDFAVIYTLIRDAFRGLPHSAGYEQDIVDALRDSGELTVSIVAEHEGEIVGHVAVSPVDVDGARCGWFGLGPIAVLPTCQGEGIGSKLMHSALKQLRDQGAKGCVLLGSPDYYSRFGFTQAAPLLYPGPPERYFQAIDFSGERPRGVVTYHAAFSG